MKTRYTRGILGWHISLLFDKLANTRVKSPTSLRYPREFFPREDTEEIPGVKNIKNARLKQNLAFWVNTLKLKNGKKPG